MNDSYEVGYKRPPKHTRFKKGASGNPKGRPKNLSKDKFYWHDLLQKEMNRRIDIVEGGKTVRVPMREAFVKKIIKDAFGKNTKSTELLLKLLNETNLSEDDTATQAFIDAVLGSDRMNEC